MSDAFSLMMNPRKKSKVSAASPPRIACPNCGASMSEKFIHVHLDSCIVKQTHTATLSDAKGEGKEAGDGEGEKGERERVCGSCTFENAEGSMFCEMCDTVLPEVLPHLNPSTQAKASNEPMEPFPSPPPSLQPPLPPKALPAPPPPSAFTTLMSTRQTPLPRYLHLTHTPPTYTVLYLSRKQGSIVTKTSLKITKTNTIELWLMTAIEERKARPKNEYERSSTFSVSVLKSILQKSVRVQNVDSALAASSEIMDKDLSQFLRRFCVIILEDVGWVDWRFRLFVWLMLADSKGVQVYNYVPRLDILSIVKDVTKCPLKLYIPFTVSREGEEGDLEKTEDGSVACLGIRRKYGGMKGDMCMLREAVNILVNGVGEEIEEAVERSCGEKVGKDWEEIGGALYGGGGAPTQKVTVKKLTMDVVQMSGVDFHCSSIISDVIEGRARNVMKGVEAVLGTTDAEVIEGEVKRSMWENCGSVNRREVVGKAAEEDKAGIDQRKILWGILKPFFEGWRKDYCRARCCK
ncbi:hypothetical protein TrST_g7704 [Triparma strigata]|uniref:Uncharacterized protein n=1 Tax=Triparma strigata TaxID=1606541 RepID=A0A9W7E0Z3_9STRA|nr:hypothetical protein TrST_g7704 [Triparma strigata]